MNKTPKPNTTEAGTSGSILHGGNRGNNASDDKEGKAHRRNISNASYQSTKSHKSTVSFLDKLSGESKHSVFEKLAGEEILKVFKNHPSTLHIRDRTDSQETGISYDQTHGHYQNEKDDDVSLISIATSRKTIVFKETKGVFENEAQNAIIQAVNSAEYVDQLREELGLTGSAIIESDDDGEDVSRRAHPSLLKGIHVDALHLFEDSNQSDEDAANSHLQENTNKKMDGVFRAMADLGSAGSNALTSAVSMFRTNNAEDNDNQNESSGYFNDQNTALTNDNNDHDDNDKNKKERNCCYKLKECLSSLCCICAKCGSCVSHFGNFLSLRKESARKFLVTILGIEALLFVLAFFIYVVGNPTEPNSGTSYVWYFMLSMRFLVTLALALITQVVLIDFLFLETKIAIRTLGRFVTLMAAQAKGWPLWLFLFGVWNFILLYGTSDFVESWIFFLDFHFLSVIIPDQNLLSSQGYRNFLFALITVGLATMVKRAIIVAFVGKRKFKMYGSQMDQVMRKILMITEVAVLAEEIELSADVYKTKNDGKYSKKKNNRPSHQKGWLFNNIEAQFSEESVDFEDEEDVYTMKEEIAFSGDEEDEQNSSERAENNDGYFNRWNKFMNLAKLKKEEIMLTEMTQSNSGQVKSLLGEWEEPERCEQKIQSAGSTITKMLEFREALDYLKGQNPLSVHFGLADTRKSCMQSAVKVFKKLLLKESQSSVVNFEKTIAVLAVNKKGQLDRKKAKFLIRLLRPDRSGEITLIRFLQACDNVYKDIRLLTATITNSTQLDDAVETILNTVFFAILTTVTFAILGINFGFFLSISSIILPMSFLFKSAVSLWLEGALFVLVREPFDIGDRIAISNPKNDTSTDGSTTWFVESFSLNDTTVRNAATNEVASYSNGYLAGSRVINAARSPLATVAVRLKFGINVSFDKIKIFHNVVENFVKERPQEWLELLGFRATAVESDLGYVGYIIVLRHVDSWQNVGSILQSKADLQSFCLEVSKQMDMRFVSPPMPVHVSLDTGAGAELNVAKEYLSRSETPPVETVGLLSKLF